MLIPDPIGNDRGYTLILACFIEQLMHDHNSQSTTVCGYIRSINILFQLRNCTIPADLSDKENICSKIIKSREQEEDIARQRSPITNEIFAYLLNRNQDNALQDSFEAAVTDFMIIIRLLGLRVSEYAQTTQNKIDVHEYPSGKRVIKAFTPLDFIIYDKNNAIIDEINSTKQLTTLKKVKVTFRIQKNRENGQSITLKADVKHPEICPVRAVHRILQRAKRLGQDDDQPLGVFINHHGIKKYLTGSKIAKLFQSVARTVHPNMTREEISRFSSHSGRVWAVVLLDEAGMSPEFIKCRLRYLSDAYRLYLRDTSVIQSKHTDALNKDSEDIIKLLGENRMILPDIVPIENDMGEYTSEN